MQRRFLAQWMLLMLASVSMTLLVIPGLAQRIFGDILGNVTDPSGAVVRDAKITLRNLDTGRVLFLCQL